MNECPKCGRFGAWVCLCDNPMPWFERAIREHEAQHGPCGDAWNISSILNCLRVSEPAEPTEAMLKAGGQAVDLFLVGQPDGDWTAQDVARVAYGAMRAAA